MKRLGLIGALALLATLIAAPAVQAAPSTGFTGTWIGVDPGDGSIQHLYVQGGTSAQLLYVDDYATVCANIGATTTFTAALTGKVSGTELDAWFKVAHCGSTMVGGAANFYGWTFRLHDQGTADPSDDTLTVDEDPTIWYRAS